MYFWKVLKVYFHLWISRLASTLHCLLCSLLTQLDTIFEATVWLNGGIEGTFCRSCNGISSTLHCLLRVAMQFNAMHSTLAIVQQDILVSMHPLCILSSSCCNVAYHRNVTYFIKLFWCFIMMWQNIAKLHNFATWFNIFIHFDDLTRKYHSLTTSQQYVQCSEFSSLPYLLHVCSVLHCITFSPLYCCNTVYCSLGQWQGRIHVARNWHLNEKIR